MTTFIYSAFADEYSGSFDEQLEGLKKNRVTRIEIRNLDGKSVVSLTDEEADAVKAKMDAAGIGFSAIGSPLGKYSITEPFEPHFEVVKRTLALAKRMGAERIRMFSFFIPEHRYDDYREEVMRRLTLMADEAERYGIILCHENEKGIYGDSPERCLDIQNTLGGRIRCIFDPANFIQCGCEPYPHAYELLRDKITYMHIKDALADGSVVPAGQGIGRIPEILRGLSEIKDELILTVEPHLTVFAGFDALENGEKTKMPFTYGSNQEAFAVAVNAIRDIAEHL